MDIRNILLKGNNLQLADTISRAIPFCKAELEFRFWEAVIDHCKEQLSVLEVKYVEDDFFQNKSKSIDNLINYQKKKDFVVFYFEIMEYKDATLYIEVGGESRIYVCPYLANNDENIEFQRYDDELKGKILDLGFIEGDEYKLLNINTKFDINSDDIYLLADDLTFKQIVKDVSDEIIGITKRVVEEFL